MARDVKLGRHMVPVLEQPLPWLERKLGKTLQAFLSGGDLSGEQFLRLIHGRVYDVLSVLIPALPKVMPRYEWEGYPSQSAMEAGQDDDEALQAAPTHAQVVRAFEAIIAENRFEVYKPLTALPQYLEKFVDPKLLRSVFSAELATLVERRSGGSSSLPSPNGDSPPPRPSMTDPTSGESEASPEVASST